MVRYLSVPDDVAQHYVNTDIWVFAAQIGLTILFALLPMCGGPQLTAEYKVGMHVRARARTHARTHARACVRVCVRQTPSIP